MIRIFSALLALLSSLVSSPSRSEDSNRSDGEQFIAGECTSPYVLTESGKLMVELRPDLVVDTYALPSDLALPPEVKPGGDGKLTEAVSIPLQIDKLTLPPGAAATVVRNEGDRFPARVQLDAGEELRFEPKLNASVTFEPGTPTKELTSGGPRFVPAKSSGRLRVEAGRLEGATPAIPAMSIPWVPLHLRSSRPVCCRRTTARGWLSTSKRLV